MMFSIEDTNGLALEEIHILATNYLGLASYTMLVYDHLLTFSDEVEYIWKGSRGKVIYLFFLNRYFFTLAFIPNLYAYISPTFKIRMCQHFVRYEGSCFLLGLSIAGLMMIVRVDAIYGRSRRIRAILGSLWAIQVAVYIWLLAGAIPVPRSPGLHGCSLIFSAHVGKWASLSAAAPLVFDTVVLLLTLHRTMCMIRDRTAGTLIKTILKDGIMYYSVIFSVNLTLTIMIATASPGIKNIFGQFAQLITATMMSRIMLHIRKKGKSSVRSFDESDKTQQCSATAIDFSATDASNNQTLRAPAGDLSLARPAVGLTTRKCEPSVGETTHLEGNGCTTVDEHSVISAGGGFGFEFGHGGPESSVYEMNVGDSTGLVHKRPNALAMI